MKIKKFQKSVKKLADYTPVEPAGLIGAAWASEEGNEVLKPFKSALKNKEDVDYDQVSEELGDNLLAIANTANEIGLSLKDIAKKALDKLSERTGKSLDDEED